MSEHYYFAASLPSLNLFEPPPLSSAEFEGLCESLLPASEAAVLRRVSLEPGEETGACEGFEARWARFERCLKSELAILRAARLGRDRPQLAYEPSLDASQAAKAAMAEESPLEAERLLDEARFRALDEIGGYEQFKLDRLKAYKLKLLLLERQAGFTEEAGSAAFSKAYGEIMKEALARAPGGER